MLHTQNINFIIANIVTNVALRFPIAYIQSISFFNDKTVVALCSWNAQQPKPVFEYFGNESLLFQQKPLSFPLQTVLINALDMEGKSIQLTSGATSMQYSIV